MPPPPLVLLPIRTVFFDLLSHNGKVLALCVHCVHIAHIEGGILTQKYHSSV